MELIRYFGNTKTNINSLNFFQVIVTATLTAELALCAGATIVQAEHCLALEAVLI